MSTPPPPPPPPLTPHVGGTAGALVPGAAPPKKSKAPFIVVGLIMAALVAGGVVLLTRKSSNGEARLDAKAAHDSLRKIVARFDFNDDASTHFARCPMGEFSSLRSLVEKQVALSDAITEDTAFAIAVDATHNYPIDIICQQGPASKAAGKPSGLVIEALVNPPPDFEHAIQADLGTLQKVTFDNPITYRGGVIERYCEKAKDATTYSGCLAAWIDETDRVLIDVFLIGSAATQDEADAALKAVLAPIVSNLAADPVVVPAGSTDTTDTSDTVGSTDTTTG